MFNIGRTKMFNQKYVLKNGCVKSPHTKKFMCYYSKMSMRFGFSKRATNVHGQKWPLTVIQKRLVAIGQKSLIVHKWKLSSGINFKFVLFKIII